MSRKAHSSREFSTNEKVIFGMNWQWYSSLNSIFDFTYTKLFVVFIINMYSSNYIVFLMFIITFFLIKGQILPTSTMFISGNVISKWTSSNSSFYEVFVYRDCTGDSNWTRVSDTQYTVKDVMLYDFIIIYVYTRASVSPEYNIMSYNGLVFFLSHIVSCTLLTDTKMLQVWYFFSHKWFRTLN